MFCHECGQEFQQPVKFCSNCGTKLSLNAITPSKKSPQTIHNHNLPEMMTAKELERFFNISQAKAYEIIHSKGFPVTKVGRSYRINRTKLLEMIEKGYSF